jgi:assimilatory nitrate reductase catalytic subunit
VRDHWHTLTRTGLAPELCRHTPEPYVEIHPADADPLGLVEGQLTRIGTAQGEAIAVAHLSDRQRPGSIFMPMHWSEAYAPSGQANPLVSSAVDLRSGQPEFKHTPARVRAYRETWRGFFIGRTGWATPAGLDLVWRRIPQDACQLHEFAGRGDEAERDALRKALARGAVGDLVKFEDAAAGSLREAHIDAGRLDRVLFTTTGQTLPQRDWLVALFAEQGLSGSQRAALLVGREPGAPVETGPVVCSCRAIRAGRINDVIAAGSHTLSAIGEATGAGITCGSCRPEIARMISRSSFSEVRDAA